MSAIEQMRANIISRLQDANEHTLRVLEAVLRVEEPAQPYTSEADIPDWQKADLDNRIAARQADKRLLISREEAEKQIKAMVSK